MGFIPKVTDLKKTVSEHQGGCDGLHSSEEQNFRFKSRKRCDLEDANSRRLSDISEENDTYRQSASPSIHKKNLKKTPNSHNRTLDSCQHSNVDDSGNGTQRLKKLIKKKRGD